jgi:hypothetical protein
LALVLALWHKQEMLTMQKRIHLPDKQATEASEEKDKYTFKDIAIIVFAWLMTLSLVYICYLKFRFFLHH